MAIYGLLYATIFRSETLDPKGGRQKGGQTNRLLATTRKLAKWPKGLYMLMYSVQYKTTWWPLCHEIKGALSAQEA
jgi:hypothetical protein